MTSPGHQFVRVGSLVPLDQEVRTIEVGTKIAEALALMAETEFDQLPVQRKGRVVGVFSFRSLAQNLPHIRGESDLMQMIVDDFVEDFEFVRAATEVGEVLRYIDAKGAVLVGDEHRLLAVATAADVSAFLWNTSRPFILLQDIELAIRSLMNRACPEPQEMTRLIREAVPAAPNEEPPTRLDDLTYARLLSVLLNPEHFGRTFRSTFGTQRTLIAATLEPVRPVRNKVFHFRDDVTVSEFQSVVKARAWLQRRMSWSA